MPMPFEKPEQQTFLAKSQDGGRTFEVSSVIEGVFGGAMGSPFVVSQDGKNVFLASIDQGQNPRTLIRSKLCQGKNFEQVRQEVKQAIDQATGGSILIKSSNDGGLTFGEFIRLTDSKPKGAVLQFGVHMYMFPFQPDGLIVMKDRHTNVHIAPPQDKSIPVFSTQNSSELLLWVSRNGTMSFDGPFSVSNGVLHSRGGWGSLLVEGGTATGEANTSPFTLYTVWTAGSPYGYSDVYFRTIVGNKLFSWPRNKGTKQVRGLV
jgi:hypothetical protein